MWKNREFKWLVAAAAAALITAVILCVRAPAAAAQIITLELAVMTALYIGLTAWRYCKLRKLSDYLHDLSDGGTSLVLEDYKEGELSYLQSEIYKLTVKLQEQAELLQKDKNYLADAISDISHQLKTPVTSMRVMTDLLADSRLPEEKRAQFTKNLEHQIDRLEWLVTALLKMAKLDAGAVQFKNESFSIRSLIDRASEHLLIPMELKDVAFQVHGAPTLVMAGDEAWLSEAVANILKNCMEHTPPGGKVTAAYEQNALYTQIRISDTGSGIAPEDLPYIFDRFYKGKNASADSVGIGLAMAKQIIQKMNGTIQVEKTSASGTVFAVRLYRSLK